MNDILSQAEEIGYRWMIAKLDAGEDFVTVFELQRADVGECAEGDDLDLTTWRLLARADTLYNKVWRWRFARLAGIVRAIHERIPAEVFE